MVILNRIVNILILLAAIAAVVFSYMLFSKREALTKGWAQMAVAINTAAKTLDDGGASGITAASDLAVDKMKHTNYEQLGQVLPKLKDNAGKIVKQRNELANAMKEAANVLSITNIDAKALKSVASYKDQERIFHTKIQEFRSVRDNVSAGYAQTVAKAGGRISAGELNNSSTYRSAIAKANNAVSDAITRRNTYSSYIAQMTRALGVKAPNVNTPTYRNELQKALREMQAKNAEFANTRSLLAAEKRKNMQLTASISNLNKTIVSNRNSMKSKDNHIAELNRILSKDGSIKIPEKYLTGKEVECYKFVKGQIEYIDKEYGFITINIGKNYAFVQQYGVKSNVVPFPLTVNKVMTVGRNLNTGTPEYVGKIIVTKVDANTSICNLVNGSPDHFKIGDAVFFSDDDILHATKKK